MKPLGDNILLEQVEISIDSGSMILTTAKEQRTRVVAVGKDVTVVKPGDFVVVSQATNVGDNVFTKESNIIAIIKGE
jgi:co-chaperonin GroES (HSP10)